MFDAICNRLATDLSDSVRRRDVQSGFGFDRFVSLLLRMYEQAEQVRDVRLRNECLDWWDRLLEARMAGPIQILGDLDAGLEDM